MQEYDYEGADSTESTLLPNRDNATDSTERNPGDLAVAILEATLREAIANSGPSSVTVLLGGGAFALGLGILFRMCASIGRELKRWRRGREQRMSTWADGSAPAQ